MGFKLPFLGVDRSLNEVYKDRSLETTISGGKYNRN